MAWIEQWRFADWTSVIVCAVGGYLLGCFTSGYYLVRARLGKDIRKLGSGSVGARNVGRVLGTPGFVLTLLGDSAKGALAVLLAGKWTGPHSSATMVAMVAVAGGHLWPVQLKFHGGKGVATSLGALLVFDYRLALAYAALFLAGLAFARKTILAGLIGFACLPPAGWWLERDVSATLFLTTLSTMVWFAHRKNILDQWCQNKTKLPKL